MGKLSGRVALVTGASKGIGAGIAKALAAEGASVVVNYASSKAGADAVVDAITKAGGKAVAVGADISNATQVDTLVDAALSNFGRLDILINNSGVYKFAPITEFDEAHYDSTFNINVRGTLLVTRAAVAKMSDGGSIVNVGSGVSRVTPPETAIYSASKGALDAITGVLARELGARNIRVNSLNPGLVETEGTDAQGIRGTGVEDYLVGQTPLGRIGHVDDIAPVAVFLASDDAKWITGEIIIASGGLR